MASTPARLLARASQAVDLVQARPARAEELARQVLADSSASEEGRATAKWALGLVARERDELQISRRELESAIATAHQARKNRLAARIQSSLALVLAYSGENQAALAATRLAAEHLIGGDAARNRMQQGLIRQRKGEFSEALYSYRLALAGFNRANDEIADVRIRLNRSVIHAYRGDLTLARTDLESALSIAKRNRQALQVAACAHNLAWVHGRRGDVPASLQMFDAAGESYLKMQTGGGRPAVLAIDRAEVLASAGLLDEAWTEIVSAVETIAAAGNPVDLAEAKLLAARLAVAREDFQSARLLATQARQAFDEQGRTAWGLQAQWIALRANVGNSAVFDFDFDSAARLAVELGNRGWQAEAVEARFETGRLALMAGDRERGRSLLLGVSNQRNGTALMRAQGKHAAALLSLAEGNERSARAALRSGLRSLIEYRAAFGSAELRAQASATSRSLAHLEISLALKTDQPWQILTAVESWRATAMQLAPVHPAADRILARDLSAVRQLDADLAQAQVQSQTTSALQARRVGLEKSIRDRARQSRGAVQREGFRFDRRELTDRLGDAALLVFFAHEGALNAVTIAGARIRVTSLGPLGPIADEVQSMLFALNRLALGRSSPASLEAAAAALAESARSLSEGLIEPLETHIRQRGLVIVPTGALHRLPWQALTSLIGRATVVTPSVVAWMTASSRLGRLTRQTRAVFAAGPELEGAAREVRQIARRYDNRLLLTGQRATSTALKKGLEAARIAHVAAHGSFRSDNALFSALRMADGPLTVYDLEPLRTVPQLLVLPACDVAVSKVLSGDELLGLAAAFLRLGAATLVAPVVPVPDGTTIELMVEFHRALLAGSTPSEALAHAVSRGSSSDPASLAARSAFLVLGAT